MQKRNHRNGSRSRTNQRNQKQPAVAVANHNHNGNGSMTNGYSTNHQFLAQSLDTAARQASLLRDSRVRRGRLLNPVQEAVLDLVLIFAALALAWWLRYEFQAVFEPFYMSIGDYTPVFIAITIGLVFVFKLEGLYDLPRSARWLDEVTGIVQGTVVGIAATIVIIFYIRELSYSRLMFLYALGLIIAILAFSRLAARLILAKLRAQGRLLERLLIVGAGVQGLRVMRTIVAQPELGYRVAGFVDDEKSEDIGRFTHLGTTDDIQRLLRNQQIDQVVIALPSASHNKIMEITGCCHREQVLFRIVPDSYELSLSRVDINELPGVPLITMRSTAITGWNRVIKRSIDILFSALILLLTSPILLLTALAIKIESPGPVIFGQDRVGEGGRVFKFYKFRSMRQNADAEVEKLMALNEASGPIFKIKSDPRRTRVGRIIRKFSIDEIPQFINIFRGDMSLVGPRPALPREVEQYQPWHMRRFEGPGGLTGLWQVSGRSELTFDEMVMLDIFYIENWSLGLDLKIILRTIPTVLFVRGAY